MEGAVEQGDREPSKFNFKKNDMSDLYLDSKIHQSLVEDLQDWSKDRAFKGSLSYELRMWVNKQKDQKLLIQTAKASVSVIDALLAKSVPIVVVEVYMNFLIGNRARIEKYLDSGKADQIYVYIPTLLVVLFLKLYKITLSQKQKHTIIKELVQERQTCRQKTLALLPKLFKETDHYVRKVLIRELQSSRKESVAGRVMKILKVPKEQYPDIYEQLLQSSAFGLMRHDEAFTWERLEEVFEIYPKAMASCIRSFANDKRTKKIQIQGFASICKRNKHISKLLPKNVEEKLLSIKVQLPNHLKNNRFSPSDAAKYFSLSDFNIRQKDVIWVDQRNLQQSLLKLSQQKLIGIDTESRVARTCLDTSRELLATIQIATPQEVYVFDAKVLKQTKIRVPEITQFFKNKDVTIIGHTLAADLNGDVTQLLGFEGKVLCKAVDICPLFKNLNPNQRKASLTYISHQVLGKQICKEYTLTNWERRPLLKNQLHYAALDAVIVIKIWQKMKEHKDYLKAEKEAEQKREKKETRKQGEEKQDSEDEKKEEQEQFLTK